MKELRKSDVIVFNRESGFGSFVKVENKGIFFMPAKKDMRLNGEKKPIRKGERFVFLGYKVLRKFTPRIIRMDLLREETGEKCHLSENDLKYFSYCETISFLSPNTLQVN
tara:strand:+ start:335 stop:664 length:330 start_codon:yes stop_codon:yes gene_type:complete